MPAANTRPVTLALLFVLVLAPSHAHAHEGAQGIVKDRMMAMENVGKAMKNLAQMVQGKLPYKAEEITAHALTIKSHAGSSLTELFPENSLQKPTAALPVIWQKWEQFTNLANRMSETADKLAQAPGPKSPTLKTDFKSLAKVCRDCHSTFRQKK